MKKLDNSVAEQLLEDASTLNPGLWIGHSKNVALAAFRIAHKLSMDSDFAYQIGLLHDIGRRFGIFKVRHSYDGFKFLAGLGYHVHARICITHSYTHKNMAIYENMDDYTSPERVFILKFLKNTEYDDYDRLIQLCDFLGLPDRLCRVEDRIEDVLSRVTNPNKAFISAINYKLKLRDYFENKMGCDLEFIYEG